MKLKFYGTRGSIPVCDAGFQQFGGNTTCLQITFTDTNRIAVIDAGTGLRNLGRDLRAIGHQQEQIVIFSGTTFRASRSLARLTIPNRKSRS
jgi:phosphoribosyl 1,2-cyclic phosphodiesterase